VTDQRRAPDATPEDTFSAAIEAFQAQNVKAVWAKALARRIDDPANAITLARTLLESICKHILDGTKTPYSHGLPLPELYKLTASALEIAPTASTERTFGTLLPACTEIVRGVGNMRNFLGDSHGHGQRAPLPDWRHAELAINLAGSVATYLLAIWENRQPTLGELITQHLDAKDHPKPLQPSLIFTLRRIRDLPLGAKVAAWITPDDLIEYCRARARDDGAGPATVYLDTVFLRGVLKRAKLSTDVLSLAIPLLTEEGLIGKAKERLRRPKPSELERVLTFFRTERQGPRVEIPMVTIIEFAAASGRRLSDITKLKWKDVNRQDRTCMSEGRPFKLVGKAWDILIAQPQAEEKIFPYVPKSISAAFARATTKIDLPDFIFNDLRLEAICRLLESGFGIHEVSEITGQRDHNIIAHVKKTLVDLPRNSS
jgi:integrase